jgi:hypothetical protein
MCRATMCWLGNRDCLNRHARKKSQFECDTDLNDLVVTRAVWWSCISIVIMDRLKLACQSTSQSSIVYERYLMCWFRLLGLLSIQLNLFETKRSWDDFGIRRVSGDPYLIRLVLTFDLHSYCSHLCIESLSNTGFHNEKLVYGIYE